MTGKAREYWQRGGKGAAPRLSIVGEDQASEEVRDCFDEITSSLGFPVVNVILRAFAKYPRFLLLQWETLKPNTLTQDFFDKTEVIRRRALGIVREHFEVNDQRAELRMRGSSDDTIKTIKAVLDFFLYSDPFLLLMASALQSSLSGTPIRGKPWAHLLPHYTLPTRTQEVTLVEIEDAPPPVQTVYREIMAVCELPFVPSDYRAVGRWSEYLELAWKDWKPKISTQAYRREIRALNDLAVALVRDLPFPLVFSTQLLKKSGYTPAHISDILATVDFFQGLFPGLITNVAALKIGLEGGNHPPSRPPCR